jgi:hypothetical protein
MRRADSSCRARTPVSHEMSRLHSRGRGEGQGANRQVEPRGIDTRATLITWQSSCVLGLNGDGGPLQRVGG